MAKESKTVERSGAAKIRVVAAQVVWLLCALLALVLAVGALLVAIDQTNESNGLVSFILDLADAVDLGVFDRSNGVMEFTTRSANALVNWGLAAVVWLIIGRLLDRLIRP
ncbi:hypothetical protein [Nocardioides dongkuii]|uniref:hypothetical protein n=1 Tax=Nocardioides dongkuii TaxID=2760089 RepID=UPI0015FC57B9|nr:hypothetical protein [Nocardioides dongkuii]